MKLKCFFLCCNGFFAAVVLQLCLANADANDGVVVKKLYEVKFDNFILSVPAPLDQSKYASSAESVGKSYVESWTSKDCSVVAFESSLIINGKHFIIPDKSSAIWYINDNIFIPNVGEIRTSPIPDRVNSAINERHDDFEVVHGGLRFVVKKSFFASADFKIDKARYDVVIGDMYFVVAKDRLIYKDKDYGRVGPGDVIRVSEDRQLTVTSK